MFFKTVERITDCVKNIIKQQFKNVLKCNIKRSNGKNIEELIVNRKGGGNSIIYTCTMYLIYFDYIALTFKFITINMTYM